MPRKLIEFITRDGQKAAKGSTEVTIDTGEEDKLKEATITIEALEKVTQIQEITISTKNAATCAYYPQFVSIEGNKVKLQVAAIATTTITVEVTALGT